MSNLFEVTQLVTELWAGEFKLTYLNSETGDLCTVLYTLADLPSPALPPVKDLTGTTFAFLGGSHFSSQNELKSSALSSIATQRVMYRTIRHGTAGPHQIRLHTAVLRVSSRDLEVS